jgi:hypothetical protein
MGKGIKRYYSIIIAAVVSLISFTLTTCNPTEPICPEPKPPGYQEDIPWPSLADSPWPMNHHDPQSTGRSKFPGPDLQGIEWIIDSIVIETGLAIGPDSVLYVAIGGSKVFKKGGLYAYNSDGTIKWFFEFPDEISSSYGSPLIGSDGTVYCSHIGASKKIFYAINPGGTLKWKVDNISSGLCINIGLDGTIYFVDADGRLTALANNGVILWTYQELTFSSEYGLSISTDGKTLYLVTFFENERLVAFDLVEKKVKWKFGKNISGEPLIDSKGNVYLIANVDSISEGRPCIFCLNDNGMVCWFFTLSVFNEVQAYIYSNPTIDKFGNIYCGADTLFSLTHDGILRWKVDILENNSLARIVSPLICDVENKIYVSVTDTNGPYIKKIIVFNSFGQIDLEINGMVPYGYLSQAIGFSKDLYIPGLEIAKLIKIK